MERNSKLRSPDATFAVVHYKKVQEVIDKMDMDTKPKNDGTPKNDGIRFYI